MAGFAAAGEFSGDSAELLLKLPTEEELRGKVQALEQESRAFVLHVAELEASLEVVTSTGLEKERAWHQSSQVW